MSNDKFVCPASQTGVHGDFTRSPRKHHRKPRFFVVCGHCGMELQATENSVFDTNQAKNRADPVATNSVSARLTDDYIARRPAGVTIRQLVEFAIDNWQVS